MPMIEWSDDLAIGIESIDAQHQILVGIINDLHDAMLARKGDKELGAILKRLADYTREHFAFEERAFARLMYTDRFAHMEEHAAFVEKVVGFTQEQASGRLLLSMQVMRFLKDWLLKHIAGSDRKYVDCLRAGGL